MKLSSFQVLVLFIALNLCVDEVVGWSRFRIRIRGRRIWRKVKSGVGRIVCRLACGYVCSRFTRRCSWRCRRLCGRKKRAALEEDGGTVIPVSMDYDSYLCDGNTQITLECFLAVFNQHTEEEVTAATEAFNAADTIVVDGFISLEEFEAAPWLLAGEEENAPEAVKEAVKKLRQDGQQGQDEGSDGSGSGDDNPAKREIEDSIDGLRNLLN